MPWIIFNSIKKHTCATRSEPDIFNSIIAISSHKISFFKNRNNLIETERLIKNYFYVAAKKNSCNV